MKTERALTIPGLGLWVGPSENPPLGATSNILTLEQFRHTQLSLVARCWLDADNMILIPNFIDTITFKSHCAKFHLPGSGYIHIDTACARVAHISGSGRV